MTSSKGDLKVQKHVSKLNFTGELYKIFEQYREPDGKACVLQFFDEIRLQGVHACTDPRFLPVFQMLKASAGKCFQEARLDFETFETIVTSHDLFNRSLNKCLVIPDFEDFSKTLKMLYLAQLVDTAGEEAKNYKETCSTSKDVWGVALFSSEGQKLVFGQSEFLFTLRECGWLILYAFILETVGFERFHKFCSYEPVPANFKEVDLNSEGKPYNPLTIAGVLVACALWHTEAFVGKTHSEKFEEFICFLMRFSGGERVNCNNVDVIDQKESSHMVKAVLYNLTDKDCLPPDTDTNILFEFFFQATSIQLNCVQLAMVGCILSNDGVNPFINEPILSQENNKNVLAMMQTCGIYTNKEDNLFEIGIPILMSTSGAGLLVVPGFFGMATLSPLLTPTKMSRRGLKYSKFVANFYNFHPLEVNTWKKICQSPTGYVCGLNCTLFNAALHGEIDIVARMLTTGINPGTKDYMRRNILHIAAAHGHLQLCKFIMANCPNLIDSRDIMDKTPYDDAVFFCNTEIVKFLKNWKDLKRPAVLEEKVPKPGRRQSTFNRKSIVSLKEWKL